MNVFGYLAGAVVIYVGVAYALTNAYKISSIVPSTSTGGASTVSETQIIVAQTIYGEARNQGISGMTAVANVIANRVSEAEINPLYAARFGIGWVNVCQKKYQFSSWNALYSGVADANYAAMIAAPQRNDAQWQQALEIAGQALSGNLQDITNGATFYQVIGTNAYWSAGITPIAIIGSQEFYTTTQVG